MEKIIFYQERTFGDKFNVTFEFVKQNWKILLRYVSYAILPLSFVGALALDYFMKVMTDASASSANDDFDIVNFGITYSATLFVCLLASLWVSTVVFSLIQAYNLRSNGLEEITFVELKPLFKRNSWRLVKCSLLIFLIVAAVLALAILQAAIIHWIVAFFMFIAIMLLLIPLLMVAPVYIYENVNVWTALRRGVNLGWKTWGGIFVLGLVLSLLSNIASTLVSLPWQVCYIVKMLFSESGNGEPTFVTNSLYTFVMYVFGIVMLYANFAIFSLFYVSTSYLYSHAAEQQDDMSLETGIAHFAELADENKEAEDILGRENEDMPVQAKEDIWS